MSGNAEPILRMLVEQLVDEWLAEAARHEPAFAVALERAQNPALETVDGTSE